MDKQKVSIEVEVLSQEETCAGNSAGLDRTDLWIRMQQGPDGANPEIRLG
jgi:hypothetical protein